MTNISDLIADLVACLDKYGDIPVVGSCFMDPADTSISLTALTQGEEDVDSVENGKAVHLYVEVL